MGRKQTPRQARREQRQMKSKQKLTKESIKLKSSGNNIVRNIVDDDSDFPKSDIFVQGLQLVNEQNDNDGSNNSSIEEIFMRGAEYGCVHSMFILGDFYMHTEFNGKSIHSAQPFFLDGAIRGSLNCVMPLITEMYMKAKPNNPQALIHYWTKMTAKYEEWSGNKCLNVKKSMMKGFKEILTKRCTVCGKQDTKTLTLRQCMGCSMHCYCGQNCQTYHWEKLNHRGECKQVKILNKYHKPYAKEIRDASIRGDLEIPALEKLRHKLGLSRPDTDNDMLRNYGIYKGKPIDPYRYIVARDDGTVWTESTSNRTKSYLRYAVGQTIECRTDDWEMGVITQLNYWQPGWENPAPYQIRLLGGKYIYAPEDSDDYIRLVK